MDKRPLTEIVDEIQCIAQDIQQLLGITEDQAMSLGAVGHPLLALIRAQLRLVEEVDQLAHEAYKAAK